ncbi:MAG TPA: ABC transporter substrate-binding protein [Chloroflexota bacterium]|nr:ABC transporter substrate-binding protein [Chloroflexota bacterium]
MVHISRRAFLRGAAASATLLLAGCGSAAAPAPSSATSGGAPSASAKPASSGSPAASTAPAAKPSAPGTASAVKGAWVALTANMMLWPLAVEAGYFDKYGVNFTLQYIQGSVTSLAAMTSNEIQMASIAGSTVVAAQAAKQDVIMTVGYVGEYFWRIMAKPNITSLDQLRGKTVAVTKVGNSDYFAWSVLANKMGWKLEDFKFVNANDAPGQVTALQAGNADAIAMSPPNDVLAKKVGAHMLLDEASYHLPNQAVGMTLMRSYLAQNRPVALNVAKATVEAIHRWKTDPAFAKGVIKKYLKQDDQDYIDGGYEGYLNLFQEKAYPSKAGFESVIEEVSNQQPAAKNVTPEQCMDTSIMQELEDSGFLKQIFGS